MKKVLVLGATGAIGGYLVPELAKQGYEVDAVSLDEKTNEIGINYIKANGLDDDVIKKLLADTHYTAILDLMLYMGQDSFKNRYKLFLTSTDQYIFFSSYRIYADEEHPIKETSPRLLETVSDTSVLSDCDREYSLYKAQEEDILNNSGFKNYTIVRPTMVYSSRRYQLVGLEAQCFLRRVAAGKKVVLPEIARKLHAAMIWSGDVAKLIAGLVENERAYGQTFTIGNGLNQTWEEVAEIYKKYVGLDYEFIDTQEYLSIFKNHIGEYRKHIYDRFYDRTVDPSKILEVTGFNRNNFVSIEDGLKKELSTLPKGYEWWENDIETAMDNFCKERNI